MNNKEIKGIINSSFNKENFKKLMFEMLDNADFSKEKTFDRSGIYIKEKFREDIKSYQRIGKYIDPNNRSVDFLIVNLKDKNKLEKARTKQKNFISDYLNSEYRDSTIVCFYTDTNPSSWRLSFVEMQYKYDKEKNKIEQEFTPAKRFSFLVGENEAIYTCCERFVNFFKNQEKTLVKLDPTIEDIRNIFNIEIVTKEFYEKYKESYEKLVKGLKNLIEKDKVIDNDFKEKNISNKLFCKKILGQIVFLYFIQKKGWLGVNKDSKFGSEDRQFLKSLFNRATRENKNFFNDYLEHLFYEALAQKNENDYFELLNCRIPFLNGGLFEPIKNYDWAKTDIKFENELFSNNNKTHDGDIGDGILDVFDRFNFTVYENEPLETEIAIDPEMLGKVFESMLDIENRKEKGAFYTPKEIVQYMCQESLINYLNTKFPKINKEDFENFIKYGEIVRENEEIVAEKQKRIESGIQKSTNYENKISKDIRDRAKEIDEALENIKVCDPAIGSGAFPVGIMNEIVRARLNLIIYITSNNKNKTESENKYNFKLQAIENSIYGVDIEDSAVEIAKLRFWLSLVIEEDNEKIKTMPNLDYKIVCGNSLLNIKIDLFNSEELKELEKLKHKYINLSDKEEKIKEKEKIDSILNKYAKEGQFDFKVFFSEVFSSNGGFDVIVANPPYVSNKKIEKKDMEIYQKLYGIKDDLYNYFFIKGDSLLTEKGILCFITSNTFLTIESKKNIRQQIQRNRLLNFVNLGGGIFDSAVVDTIITMYRKENSKENYTFNYIDIEEEKQNKKNFNKTDFHKFKGYKANIDIFRNVLNNVFFTPNDYNMKIYHLYSEKVKELYDIYYDKIKDSKSISKYQNDLQQYRESLKEGDIVLLGLITDGGQGLATANNGKYIVCLEGTKYAIKIKEERWKKLKSACEDNNKIIDYINLFDTTNQGYKNFLNSKTEEEIENLFDELKEKFGRDIFGQGYLFKIVKKENIANVDELTDEEKLNGIDESKPTYVPYDKGDKDGNRWYLETPYYINWSRKNVRFLKTDSKARWQGYQFYFKEGFCWNSVLLPTNEESKYIKCRVKQKTINDVQSMSLYNFYSKINVFYIVSILNSKLMYNYLKTFINSSAALQINNFRLLPIIIPTKEQLTKIENIANQFIENKKEEYKNGLNNNLIDKNNSLENELNDMVTDMYLKQHYSIHFPIYYLYPQHRFLAHKILEK